MCVDDQALVRHTLTTILETDPDIKVMATAKDPFVAAEKMKQQVPDVIVLDIEMPRMDGLTFLQKIMSQHPIPVVICSSQATEGSRKALLALEYGAVEIITKPKISTKKFLEESTIRICDVVKAAAQARVTKQQPFKSEYSAKLTADAVLEKAPPAMLSTTDKVLLLGASTGGTEALAVFLQALPKDSPPVAIVQHMPENFTAAFARRLDQISHINVKEAEDGDSMVQGQALIAPGSSHMLLKRSGRGYYVHLKSGPLVSRHRPSVDVLFRSGAQYAGNNVIAALMTGMGDDGAKGMRELFDAGAITIAQDEASSVVFGMPKEAIKLGGVHTILPLNLIAPEMLRLAQS